jgi:hypothetical protein
MMLNSVVNCSVVSFYVWFNLLNSLLIYIVLLIGKLTYLSLMSRVMSLNVLLIVISSATSFVSSAAYVLSSCK